MNRDSKDSDQSADSEPSAQRVNAQNYTSVLDQIIGNAMAQGKFDNLAGRGKPQRLDEDSHIPEDMRLGLRLLKNNEFAPPWIEALKEVEREQQELANWLTQAQSRWAFQTTAQQQAARAAYQQKLTALHRLIMNYNLNLPPGGQQLPNIRIKIELQRLGGDST